MRRLIAVITASTCLVVLLASSGPVQAAPDETAMAPTADATLHALSRMSAEARDSLTPLTDDELAGITGAAGGSFGLGANLGIIVQINVCAVCTDVRQNNVGIVRPGRSLAAGGRGLSRFSGLR